MSMSTLPTCFFTRVAAVAAPWLLAAASAAAQSSGTAAPPLATPAADDTVSSKVTRCQALTGEFQAACEVRIMGSAASSGAKSAPGTHPTVTVATQPQARANEPESTVESSSVPTVVVPSSQQ